MSNRPVLVRIVAGLSLIVCLAVLSAAALADDDELVAFNTKTLKYHCLSCEWAVKCTQNCITIRKSEAIKRGGVPCKVCGGSCNKRVPYHPSSSRAGSPSFSAPSQSDGSVSFAKICSEGGSWAAAGDWEALDARAVRHRTIPGV